MKRFEDQTAIVTGGGQGLGLAITKEFLAEGCRVIIVDIDDRIGRKAVESLSTKQVDFIYADVADANQVTKTIATVNDQLGRIDILVNNAGIIRDNVIWKMSEDDYDLVLNVNLKGPWLMCRAVAPVMREQKYGRIVNISSRSWLGNFGQTNYSASKGGIVSLTRTLSLELAKYNVTVNAVAPGLIDTPLTRGLSEEVLKRLINLQPSKKIGQPKDIANAVSFLASKEAEFITGQVLHVDGGKSVGLTSV